MSYTDVPNSVRSLEQRIRNLEDSEELALRRRVGMALVVDPVAADAALGWLLAAGVLAWRSAAMICVIIPYYQRTAGVLARALESVFTQDLDAARVQPLARFRSDFEDSLSAGWPALPAG